MKKTIALAAILFAALTAMTAQTFRPTPEGGTAIPLGKSNDTGKLGDRESLKEYLQFIEDADAAVAAKDWQRAEDAYRNAMDVMPDNPNNLLLLSNIGMMQHYAGENGKALVTLSDAHFIGPKSTTILNNRATVLRALRKYPEAIADYDKVLEIDSVNPTALFNRGYTRTLTGDVAGAEADLVKYERVTGDSINTASALAVLYSNADRPAEAIPYYTTLVKSHPTASAYAARAMCYLALEKLPEAAEDIADGMALNPDNGELYYCRAYLNILRFDKEAAKADAARAAELGVEQDRIDLLFAE